MKTVIKAIIFLLIGLTVIFYGGAYMLPGDVRVERSMEIAASPEKVFAIAGNLRRTPEWSPWVAVDPATTFSFEGPEQGGVGQVMRWASGNPLVGSGSETVTEYVVGERLGLALDYAGFGKASVNLQFTPAGNGTHVTWTFVSALPGVIDRWAGLLVDRQAGDEIAKALTSLKTLAEAAPISP